MKYASKKLQEREAYLRWKAKHVKESLAGQPGSAQRRRIQIIGGALLGGLIAWIIYTSARGLQQVAETRAEKSLKSPEKDPPWLDDVLRTLLPGLGEWILKRLDRKA